MILKGREPQRTANGSAKGPAQKGSEKKENSGHEEEKPVKKKGSKRHVGNTKAKTRESGARRADDNRGRCLNKANTGPCSQKKTHVRNETSLIVKKRERTSNQEVPQEGTGNYKTIPGEGKWKRGS